MSAPIVVTNTNARGHALSRSLICTMIAARTRENARSPKRKVRWPRLTVSPPTGDSHRERAYPYPNRGFGGYDCSEVRCTEGQPWHSDLAAAETAHLRCDCAAGCGGCLKLRYRGALAALTPAMTAAEVRTRLLTP
jgi:hypothetical protein